ncbi:amino acid racemase [Nocardioides carbamazepini]|uniref:aspartate/glutamate racemase family protein n=1 Tax=Nocardioides carbamazepini TaxID=2854259 RepID=UPI002149F22A|nr:amino acid racemase [Nocardioides carbamazepini]MCR1783826.1 amino acid racemase [Nocardioides carbamazepini]
MSLLGVLGGMGPMATATFYRDLVRRTPARSDQEHIPVVIWSDGRVPDRSEALLGHGPSPLPQLVEGVKQLQAMGADLMAMPCNTAHAFLPGLRRATGADFVDIVRATVAATIERHPETRHVGVLGTRGTRIARLYETACSEVGLAVIQPTEHDQSALVDEAIRLVKGGGRLDHATRLVEQATRSLAAAGADVAVAACTEIPLAIGRATEVLPIVDSVECLADACIEACAPRCSTTTR